MRDQQHKMTLAVPPRLLPPVSSCAHVQLGLDLQTFPLKVNKHGDQFAGVLEDHVLQGTLLSCYTALEQALLL